MVCLAPVFLVVTIELIGLGKFPPFIQRAHSYVNNTFYLGELNIRDNLAWHGKKAPIDDDLVYLAVDNASIVLDHLWEEDFEASEALRLMKSGWPYPRSVYAYILDRLFDAGAKVVILDFLFLTPTENDFILKASLDKYRDKVVVGANYSNATLPNGNVVIKLDIPYETIITQKDPLDKRIAYVNFPNDEDDIIRNLDFYKANNTTSITARALEILGEDQYIHGIEKRQIIRFGEKAGAGYLPHSVANIFVDSYWENNYQNGDFFKNKIILLGPYGNWSQDYHMTPVGNMPGPELHLNALAAARHAHFISETPIWMQCIIVLLSALLAWILSISMRQPLFRAVLILLTNGLFLGLLFYLYNAYSFYLIAFAPLFVFNSGSIFSLALEYAFDWMEKNRVRSMLDTYVSKNVVKQILDSPDAYMESLGGVRKPVTVFFSDVRGFTTMTEAVSDSQQFVTQLNEYFTAMVDCVFDHNGTLDKFIGDAIMAVWGNTTSEGIELDAKNGVKASLAMLNELDRLNADWQRRGMIPFKIGMGLNYGEVIVGNMGSLKKKEFTVIGDAVNLASRLEGVTKTYGIEFCMGESIAELVKDEFIIQTVDLIKVKGKTKPVEVFTVHSEKVNIDQEAYTWLEHFEKGIILYRNKSFVKAEESFNLAYSLNPEDSLCSLYVKRSQDCQFSPPPEEWDGVYEMKTK